MLIEAASMPFDFRRASGIPPSYSLSRRWESLAHEPIKFRARQISSIPDDRGDLAGIGDIRQRIGIEQKQIGPFAGFHGAAVIGDAEPLTGETGRARQDLAIAHPGGGQRFQLVMQREAGVDAWDGRVGSR